MDEWRHAQALVEAVGEVAPKLVEAVEALGEKASQRAAGAVPLEKQAVLLAPTEHSLESNANEATLLNEYDYTGAKTLTADLRRYGFRLSPEGKIQHQLPRVFILGSTILIERFSETAGVKLQLLDLTIDPRAVEAKIGQFENCLLTPGTHVTTHPLIERVLAGFRSVGAFEIVFASVFKSGAQSP